MSVIWKKIDFRYLLIIFASLLLLTVVGVVAANSSYLLKDAVYGGVTVDGVPLDGLTQKEAEAAIINKIKEIKAHPILKIKFENQSWPIMDKDIDWQVNPTILSQKAYEIGRTGNIFEQLQERFFVYNNGKNIEITGNYNEGKLKKIIAEIASKLYRLPENASVAIVAGKQELKPEINGVKVDQKAALELMQKTIQTKISGSMHLPVLLSPAKVTSKDLADITDVLASYSTYFNQYMVNRSHNVGLAAQYLNSALLKPGEVFSFNKGIGPRSVEMGYRDAPVYIGEEVVPGIGGGICQVSSTLYNAALFANLEIVERSNHIRPVPYVPLGQDATISEDILDLKFKNNTSHNIYIHSWIKNNEITVEILGKKTPDMPQIKIVADNIQVISSKTIIKQDKTMPEGEKKVEKEGEQGIRVTTYRLKYLNDKLIESERLYYDDYPVIDTVIKVGTKPVSKDPRKEDNKEENKEDKPNP